VKQILIGRSKEAKVLSAALASNEHLLFVGTKGTAKSALVMNIYNELVDYTTKNGLKNPELFHCLMMKTMPREELEGPVDIKAMTELGEYVRKIVGMLPTVEIAILEEVFNASDVVLNTLNSIMNEREYRNGTNGTIKVPLQTMIGTTNQVPSGKDLAAQVGLYDRWTYKIPLRNLPESNWEDLADLMVASTFEPHKAELDDPKWANMDARLTIPTIPFWAVQYPKEVKECAIEIRRMLQMKFAFEVSDRKFGKGLKAVGTWAALAGRDVVNTKDCEALRYVWWDAVEQYDQFATTISTLSNPTQTEIDAIVNGALALYEEQKDRTGKMTLEEAGKIQIRFNDFYAKLKSLGASDEELDICHQASKNWNRMVIKASRAQ